MRTSSDTAYWHQCSLRLSRYLELDKHPITWSIWIYRSRSPIVCKYEFSLTSKRPGQLAIVLSLKPGFIMKITLDPELLPWSLLWPMVHRIYRSPLCPVLGLVSANEQHRALAQRGAHFTDPVRRSPALDSYYQFTLTRNLDICPLFFCLGNSLCLTWFGLAEGRTLS